MEKLLKQLIERVDVLIKLQILTGLKNQNQGEKIIALHSIGIAQADIASIMGIKINTVTATVSQMRRKNSAKKPREETGNAQ
jgi:DNA-directed RNA polymerase specialized sigma24 family protein